MIKLKIQLKNLIAKEKERKIMTIRTIWKIRKAFKLKKIRAIQKLKETRISKIRRITLIKMEKRKIMTNQKKISLKISQKIHHHQLSEQQPLLKTDFKLIKRILK